MFEFRVVVLLFALCQIPESFSQSAPIVDTSDGKIQGQIAKSTNGRDYMEFRGIPYSEPRMGRKRFDPPEPKNKWHGILVANLTSTCLQVQQWDPRREGTAMGEDDCLHLNIFVPGNQINTSKPYDVIMMIHWGAFNFGNQAFFADPKYLMDRDVILASFNYRVGISGFLSTGDRHLPGNNGLKDQSLAMKWIKDNIAYFGGNPASITLAGTDAGGASAHYHYLSPLSKGLFNRGISSGGSTLNSWALQEEPLKRARIVGKAVSCNQKDTGDLVECLKSKDGNELNEAIKKLRSWIFNPLSPLGPVVDKFSPTPFMPEHPYALLAKGLVNDVPWIFSDVSSEGLYQAAQFHSDDLAELDERWDEILPAILHYEDTIEDKLKSEIAKKIRKHYFEDKAINEATFDNLVQMVSDRNYLSDVGLASKLQANVSAHNVYFYIYDYRSAYEQEDFVAFQSMVKRVYCSYLFIFYHWLSVNGVSHAMDMIIFFEFPKLYSDEDKKMKDFMLDLWTSFAKFGHPGIEKWAPLNKSLDGTLNYLYIGRTLELETRSEADYGNATFWHNLPFAENANLFKRN